MFAFAGFLREALQQPPETPALRPEKEASPAVHGAGGGAVPDVRAAVGHYAETGVDAATRLRRWAAGYKKSLLKRAKTSMKGDEKLIERGELDRADVEERNENRVRIAMSTRFEVDDEVEALLGSGNLDDLAVDELIARKERELEVELEHAVNLTADDGSDAKRPARAWRTNQIDQIDAALDRLPEGHLGGVHQIRRVAENFWDGDESTLAAHYEDQIWLLDDGVRKEDFRRHNGDESDLAERPYRRRGGDGPGNLEFNLTHEIGHEVAEQDPDALERFREAAGWQQDRDGKWSSGSIPADASWSYARTDPDEHFAETYAKAVLVPETLHTDLVAGPEAELAAARRALIVAQESAYWGEEMGMEAGDADARIAAASARFTRAAAQAKAMKQQWTVMREDVFGVTDASVEAQAEALSKRGVGKEGLAQFREQAARAMTPEQLEKLAGRFE